MKTPIKYAFVICCNDDVKFVYVGKEKDAEAKKAELKEEHYKYRSKSYRSKSFPAKALSMEVYENWFYWHIRTVEGIYDHEESDRTLLVRVTWEEEHCRLHIIKQGSRLGNFTPYGNTFMSSNGLQLTSISRPAFAGNTLFCRGTNSDADYHSVIIPKEKILLVSQAIEEYNNTFKNL